MVLENFWSHVVRSADAGACQILSGIEYLGDSEISQLYPVLFQALIFFEEEVLRLEVAVQDLLVVQVVDG